MISVIICTFNRANQLAGTLQTLHRQEGIEESEWELLVVDNNSKDATRNVVQDFARSTKVDVRYHHQSRQGKSFALNTGIEESRGELLAFTDDDVTIDPHWLSSIRTAATDYHHLGFGGRVLPVWPDDMPNWIALSGPYSRPVVGGPIAVHDPGNQIREYDQGMWAPVGGNMFYRREAFHKYGLFNTSLGPFGERFGVSEDCEIGFRLMKKGERLLYCPSALVYHPVPPAKLSREYLLEYARNSSYQTAKHEIREGVSISRRAKAVMICALHASKCAVKASFHRRNPAAEMHYHFLMKSYLSRIRAFSEMQRNGTSGRTNAQPERTSETWKHQKQ